MTDDVKTVAKINCDGINCDNYVEFEMPQGWDGFYSDDEEFHTFCPSCKEQRDWRNDQCVGCVSGFPDCGLGEQLYCSRAPLNADERDVILSGRCPFRVNGTFMMNGDVDADISDVSQAGGVILKALDEYRARYCTGK